MRAARASQPCGTSTATEAFLGCATTLEGFCTDPKQQHCLDLQGLEKEGTLLPTTAAEWRAIVRKEKVPLRLATALVTVTNNPALLLGLHLAIGALSKYASAVLVTRKDPQHANSNSALQAAIKQQLQDGLLQQLPGVLAVATARVISSARRAQQQTDPANQVPDLADRTSPVSHAVALLELSCLFVELFAPERLSDTNLDRSITQALVPSMVAILRLAAAVMSRCSWRCGSMPGPQLPPSAVRRLLPGFLPAAGMVAMKTCHLLEIVKARSPSSTHAWSLQDGPHVQQLLASDCIVPLLAACISSLVCHKLDSQLTAAANSGSSSSSSSSLGPQASVQLQPTNNLQLLLDSFGIDSATAVCAGRVLQDAHEGRRSAALSVMIRFHSDINYFWIKVAAQQAGALLPLVSPQEQQLHLLLPAAALQWATSCLPALSDSSPGTDTAAQEQSAQQRLDACEVVSRACYSGACRWQLRAFKPVTPADSWLQQAFPLEDWAAELLPLLLQLASSNLVDGTRLAGLVGTAAQQATGGSSSSNSSRRHSCPAVTRRVSKHQSMRAHDTVGTTVAAISLLLDNLDRWHTFVSLGFSSSSSNNGSRSSSRSRSNSRNRSSSISSVSGQHGSRELQAMLQPHTLQLLQTSEAFTRSTASLVAAETRAGPVAGGRAADSTYSVWACQCILITVASGQDSPLEASGVAAGPGSQECQQLCSLLLSLLKCSSLVPDMPLDSIQQSVFGAVAAVLQSPELALAQPAAAPAGTPQSTGPSAAAVPQGAVGSPLACMLQLFGRACLQLAQHMPADEGGYAKCLPFLKEAAAACQEALQAPALSQQLSVAGCDPQQLLTQLSKLLALLQSGAGAADDPTAASLTRVQQQLQVTGAAFTAVPSSQMCNNPSCTCVDGSSEQGLVARRSSLCAGCRTARYCGRSCLAAHWKRHKPVCKAIAAAAAGMAE